MDPGLILQRPCDGEPQPMSPSCNGIRAIRDLSAGSQVPRFDVTQAELENLVPANHMPADFLRRTSSVYLKGVLKQYFLSYGKLMTCVG